MDRDKLAEKAVDFYIRWMQDPANEGCTWGTKGVLADFALEVLAERDTETRQAELESLRRTTCPECGCGI